MTKKSEPENTAENGEEKAAEKAPARKTIRRVRKVASRKAKSSEDDQVDPAKEVVTPLVDADQGEDGPKKKTASKAANSEQESAESKNDRSRDSDHENKGESDRSKRKIGRVRKESSAGNRGADGEEERRGGGERRSRGRGRQSSRPRSEPVNVKALARKAWKLFHADIAEEGIALVDDKAGRHLALRSFDLARIFLEEKARQKRAASAGKDTAKKENGKEREDKREREED